MTEQNDGRSGSTPAMQSHGITTGRFPPSHVGVGRVLHTVYPIRYMVVVGTLGSGFNFYGPFKDPMAAERWVEKNLATGTTVRIERFNLVREDA